MNFEREISDEYGSEKTGKRAELDWYKTPPGATRRLFEKLPWIRRKPDAVKGGIWEPAAGDGSMGMEIAGCTEGWSVAMSDISPRGSLAMEYGFEIFENDFLRRPTWYQEKMGTEPGMIVTNPPFRGIEDWILKAVDVVSEGGIVAMLARLQLLEGQSRAERLFRRFRPRLVLVFPERLSMWKNGVKPEGTGKTAYAWFVWDTMWFTKEFRERERKGEFSPWTQVQWLFDDGPDVREGF